MSSIQISKSKIINNALSQNRKVLNEFESKQFLSEFGLPITKQLLKSTEQEAIAAAKQIQYPVVMKIISDDIVHKTDVGGVKVNIKNENELIQSFRELMSILSKSEKKVSIQEMAPKPITELIIGTLQDPQFGPAIMFGIGGVLVEIMKDVSFRICPITEFDANEMIHEIKGFKLLDGYRGAPKADLDALKKLLIRISEIAMEYQEIDQMDLNPVFIYNNGLKIIDARIILK